MSTMKEVLRLKYLSDLTKRNIEHLGVASKSAVSETSQYVSRRVRLRSRSTGDGRQETLSPVVSET